MTLEDLIFIITFGATLVVSVAAVVRIARRRPAARLLKTVLGLIGGYGLLWVICWCIATFKPVAMGTDVCFDDWCATVMQADHSTGIQQLLAPVSKDSMWVVVDVLMANHARGIAQKPSQPRVLIIDKEGRRWPSSYTGQMYLEQALGKVPPLDARLELHASLPTKLVFALPLTAKGLKVLIEEGPWITKLILPQSRPVFEVKD